MLFELENTSKIKALFTGWEETMIFSCLQKIMGKIYVTDLENPKSKFIEVIQIPIEQLNQQSQVRIKVRYNVPKIMPMIYCA